VIQDPFAMQPISESLATNPQAAANTVNQGIYQEWMTSNLPLYQQLENQLTWNNPGIVKSGVDSAVGNVDNAFNAQTDQLTRGYAAAGIAPTAEQSAVDDRVMTSRRSTADVDAANRTRQQLGERDRLIGNAVMVGGTDQLSQATNALNSAAGTDASRIAANTAATNQRTQTAMQNLFDM
jgi:hypothetical protein